MQALLIIPFFFEITLEAEDTIAPLYSCRTATLAEKSS
jgi:hypothetical protein